MKILIADDDADIRALVGFALSQAGFQVCAASDGDTALQVFSTESPDFILLDVNMPAPDGLEVCRCIRERSSVPVMMLTVRDSEEDLIAALNCGADDYVTKPFSPRALLARVRALARRSETTTVDLLTAGMLRLDRERQTLQIGATAPLPLTPLEFKALYLLMINGGRTVTVERLLLHLWGRAESTDRRTLKQLIYRLRRKLEAEPAAPQLLQTTPGAGYRLNVEQP